MRILTRRAVLAFSAVLIFSAPVWGQRSTIRRVNIATVKPDRTSDFEAAVKQYNEIYAKIPGAGTRGVFQSMTGSHQFMLVRDYEKWEDLDAGPVATAVRAHPELSRLNAHIAGCFESSSTLIEELLPELSMPRPSSPPTLIRLARSRIRADKTAEFESILLRCADQRVLHVIENVRVG